MKKSKKKTKVRDMKPSKDAKGGRFTIPQGSTVAGGGKVAQGGSSLTGNTNIN
jgi:hypothetical protein